MRLLYLVISGNIVNLIISLHHEDAENFDEIEKLLLYAFFANAIYAIYKIDFVKTIKTLTRRNV